MRRRAAVLTLPFLALLAGCSSPADVARSRNDVLANNARALYDNDQAMVKAQEWNVRIAGMPASGVLTLWIVTAAALVLIVAVIAAYRFNVRREEFKHTSSLPCQVCGANDPTNASLRRSS